MAHLIDKSALVAEVERLKADALQKKSQCKRSGLERIMHQIGAYNKILSFLDTLEVKEVGLDFEQELYKAFGQVKDFTLGMRIAKRFYEMGRNYQEPVIEDLEELIDKLSAQFPEVSFAKLSRIAVRVAKWQLWQINEVLLSEVLPCFMHGGEADEVVAKLDEVLNKKK